MAPMRETFFATEVSSHRTPKITLKFPLRLRDFQGSASREGFALEQVLQQLAAPDEAYFWVTHAGAELDLLMLKDGRRVGAEFNRCRLERNKPRHPPAWLAANTAN
jgi:hypothetical protein